jgi:exodeoxyribonuclease VII large subunit
MEAYSLYELNEYIRRVIALNFPESFWVSAEISQVKESRGNVYLELIQKEENSDEVIAQTSAVIWYKSYLFIKNKTGALLPSLLTDGTQVKVKVAVEFHERYGMKLFIEDIDPAFTIGQLEMQRQKIIQRLKVEAIIDKNKKVRAPKVLQRLAVISAENAAGYQDFISHLEENIYGFAYKCTLFQAALQGSRTEVEVTDALKEISGRAAEFDAVVIIRGGGSKLDLAAFDNYNIAYAVTTSPLPVLTGIGHDIDQTVTDMVAYRSLKTPTAVAGYILDGSLLFETEIVQIVDEIKLMTSNKLEHSRNQLQQHIQWIRFIPGEYLIRNQANLKNIRLLIQNSTRQLLEGHKEKLIFAEKQIAWADPKHVLKRGFTLVRDENKIMVSAGQIEKGKQLTLEFFDGQAAIITI